MAYIDHAFYDTPEHGENMSYDIHETDFHIQYAFNGTLDGLSLCARYALVDADEDYGGVDYGDMRFYITYKFAFSGK